MSDLAKNFVVWIILAAILMFVFNSFSPETEQNDIDYSAFLSEVRNDRVSEVTIADLIIYGERNDGSDFRTVRPNVQDPKLMDDLVNHNVRIVGKEREEPSLFSQLLVAAFPILLILAIFVFFMRQMQGGGGGRGGPMSFGKSKAKLLTGDQINTTFADVAGVDEAKEDVSELVEFLSDPGKFQRLGGRIPKGVLMVGPPGTGKTLLAKAIAGEAKVPFFSISGSDFVEMFVGVGASRVRDMFEQAKKQSPCIIFIDEIDAVGRHRGGGYGGGNDEREQTLNQLLVEMDGFEANAGVIIVAATNRPDVLDPALLRPGRFDRQVTVSNPDILGRDKILKVHIKKIKVSPKFDSRIIARGTPGFSGADLANLVNEAALMAARKNKRMVTLEDFEYAKDKVMLGAERRSMVMTQQDKEITAYHEAGHALANIHSKEAEPIYKSSIIPTGRALGYVMSLPEKDKVHHRKDELEARLVTMVAARISEEIIFGKEKVATGAVGDIQQATDLARKMITEFGFSDKLGFIRYSSNQEEVFLGHSVAQSKNVSEDTAKIIDSEVKRLVEEAKTKAKKILTDNIDQLHIIAKGLLEYETLTGDEIKDLLNGIKPSRDDLDGDIDKPTKTSPSVPKTGGSAPAPAN